ncbi:MAG: hypothetical protein L0Y64_09190 [Myxococcaceae bacterium]|nr:hypothetical protein [Myxococcaceae bacterium]
MLLLVSCARVSEDVGLEAGVKAGLAERERRLLAYRVTGTVQDGGGEARFTFAFRTPDRMRGEVGPPVGRTFAFDGSTLRAKASAGGPVQEESLVGLPRPEVAARLYAVFNAFVSEGFRVPLLSPHRLQARRVTHPRAAEAVELVTTVTTPGEAEVTATYVLRWPTLDFLEKRLTRAGTVSAVRVDEEHCDAALRLCVPRAWTHWSGGAPVATVRLSEVSLGEALPQEAFTLSPPSQARTPPQVRLGSD